MGSISEMKAEWVKKVMDHREFFLDESKWKVDEAKRPDQSKHEGQVFNMQGSFRTLNID